MTGRTRRQHYVPSCYLAQWATPSERTGRLYVFDRSTGKMRPSTPGNEAHVRDFYAVTTKERGDSNVAEEALSKLEGIFGPALTRVNETSALPAQKRPLMAFIAMQAVRTPSARAWFADGYNDMSMSMLKVLVANKKAFFAQGRKIDPGATDEELKETFEAAQEFLRAPGARVEVDQTTLVRNAFEVAAPLEDALASRCWLLGIAPDDTPVVTSDDPIVLDWNGRGEPPAAWNPGIADPNTVVLVAVGPRHILAGLPTEPGGKRRKSLSRGDVAHFNALVALRAERFVYAASESFAFERDGKVDTAPDEWLIRRPDDERGGKKRGVMKVVTSRSRSSKGRQK